MQVTERETIARPLAPPDVGSLSSEDDSDPEEEEQEEEEVDGEVVAEAVDNLLLDIEVSLPPPCVIFLLQNPFSLIPSSFVPQRGCSYGNTGCMYGSSCSSRRT